MIAKMMAGDAGPLRLQDPVIPKMDIKVDGTNLVQWATGQANTALITLP